MNRLIKYGVMIVATACFMIAGQSKKSEASSKVALINQVKAKTTESIRDVYYTDYDYDGSKEAFIITEKSEYDQTLWFSSEKEVKEIVTAILWTGEGKGICKVSDHQKLFVAEGGSGGSGSWSCCLYVKNGKAVQVKAAGEGLTHLKGKDFSIYPSAFDHEVDAAGLSAGHTWKAYYLKWNGKKFVEYVGKKISQQKLKSYKGAERYIRKAQKLGYTVGDIYYRKNGVINVNLSKPGEYEILQENITFYVQGNKVSLWVHDKKGKNIVEKSSYGGKYRAKGF